MTQINSKTFCTLPFLEYFRKNGEHKLCCIGPTIPYTSGNDDNAILDFMNSPEMIEIRRKMANGEKVDACAKCYDMEEITGKSKRTQRNDQFLNQYDNHVNDIIKNDMKIETLKNLNFRPDRLCNLQCKMCGNWSSSQIVKEERKIFETDGNEYFEIMGFDIPDKYIPDDNTNIMQDIDAVLDGLELLEFAGGEPTLIPEVSEIMQKCIDRNIAKNIFIKMPINVTNVTDKFIEQLSHFKYVQLDCSIDGVAEIQEYIRYPSNWKTIEANFIKLMQTDFFVKVLYTVQNLNVLTIDKLVKWSVDLTTKYRKTAKYQPFYVNVVTMPEYLHCAFMPNNIKKEASQSVHNAIEIVQNSNMTEKQKEIYKSQLSIVENILQTDVEIDFVNFNKLKYYLKYQDSIRSQDINNVVPQIGSWLNGQGI